MIGFLKNWALPIAMITGAAGYPLFLKLSFLTPYLIFTMLLLTFCKISPDDMRPRRMHLWLLTIQVLGSVAVYLALLPLGKAVAEGAMVCVICPTATAAAVITHKLGGNAASLTTYTLIGNIGTAIAIPLFFPAIEPHAQISFATSFLLILGKVFPLLICPFIAAMLLRFFAPKAHAALQRLSAGAFYLWTVALAIVTAQTLSSILEQIATRHKDNHGGGDPRRMSAAIHHRQNHRQPLRRTHQRRTGLRTEKHHIRHMDGTHLSRPPLGNRPGCVCAVAKYSEQPATKTQGEKGCPKGNNRTALKIRPKETHCLYETVIISGPAL